MNKIIEFYHLLADTCGVFGTILIALTIVLFIVQLYYYGVHYGKIIRYRNPPKLRGEGTEGVSVIVLLGDNSWYLDNTLPKLMSQSHPNFEVVIVEVGTTEDFSDELSIHKLRYPNLVSTRIDSDPRFPISNKMAYNLGIKAASFDRIILTTDSAYPTSEKWLSFIARGFEKADIVLGYCGMEHNKGSANALMRCSRLMMSVRYLASAVRQRPYRGIIHNLGITKKIYFEHRGFGSLNMNLGEDDLFIQSIADSRNTTVVISPYATMRQVQRGGLKWWREQVKFYESTRAFYPDSAKKDIQWELGSRLLFFMSVIVLAVIMPWQVEVGAIGLMLIRAFFVRWKMWKIRKRLGEKDLGWALSVFDITEPFERIRLYISMRICRPKGVWR